MRINLKTILPLLAFSLLLTVLWMPLGAFQPEAYSRIYPTSMT